MRPSYVLGGQNMIIAHNDDDIKEYMDIILSSEHRQDPYAHRQIPHGHLKLKSTPYATAKDILNPRNYGARRKDRHPLGRLYRGLSGVEALSDEHDKKKLSNATKESWLLALNTRGLVNIQYLMSRRRSFMLLK